MQFFPIFDSWQSTKQYNIISKNGLFNTNNIQYLKIQLGSSKSLPNTKKPLDALTSNYKKDLLTQCKPWLITIMQNVATSLLRQQKTPIRTGYIGLKKYQDQRGLRFVYFLTIYQMELLTRVKDMKGSITTQTLNIFTLRKTLYYK